MDEKYRRPLHYALVCFGVHIYSKTKWNSMLNLSHQLFNTFIAISVFIFTSGFIIVRTDDVLVWIEGFCIWITGVIIHITTGVALVFRKEFRQFVEEMALTDAMQKMPFIRQVLKNQYEKGKLKELKDIVLGSQEKLLKYTSLLLKCYTTSVLSTAFLYISDAIYQMIVREDESLRLLGFDMWFPWKLDDFNVYIGTFIFHVYAGFFCAMGYPALQSTIVLLMGQIIRQLRILTFILDNLDELVIEMCHRRDVKWQLYCTAVLSQSIDHYNMIKR
ncbi:hypothetical protein O0L34_g18632 [Tuta absoluta]|nr:hypothetical protein O0L34_g18632 [Tuta absoluta]